MEHEEDIVTVYRTDRLWEAAMVQMWLEDEGMECAIVGQHLAQVFPLWNVTPIEVQVLARDRERALEIITEHETQEPCEP